MTPRVPPVGPAAWRPAGGPGPGAARATVTITGLHGGTVTITGLPCHGPYRTVIITWRDTSHHNDLILRLQLRRLAMSLCPGRPPGQCRGHRDGRPGVAHSRVKPAALARRGLGVRVRVSYITTQGVPRIVKYSESYITSCGSIIMMITAGHLYAMRKSFQSLFWKFKSI